MGDVFDFLTTRAGIKRPAPDNAQPNQRRKTGLDEKIDIKKVDGVNARLPQSGFGAIIPALSYVFRDQYSQMMTRRQLLETVNIPMPASNRTIPARINARTATWSIDPFSFGFPLWFGPISIKKMATAINIKESALADPAHPLFNGLPGDSGTLVIIFGSGTSFTVAKASIFDGHSVKSFTKIADTFSFLATLNGPSTTWCFAGDFGTYLQHFAQQSSILNPSVRPFSAETTAVLNKLLATTTVGDLHLSTVNSVDAIKFEPEFDTYLTSFHWNPGSGFPPNPTPTIFPKKATLTKIFVAGSEDEKVRIETYRWKTTTVAINAFLDKFMTLVGSDTAVYVCAPPS